ncbi:MAG: EutN/CcmL family microcompartment protein [Oscillospiraceae bacterium]|jgi:ethanolamine utilization protein EutN|nr:EutN/CcmL family microcompartment protein [Oscillospiraceae bacterium]
MMICSVVGHVWATKKEASLAGLKLMVVQEEVTNQRGGETFVAADAVGAGIGERVLVVTGSTARRALGSDTLGVDCAIVGIIDALEVDKENRENRERSARGATVTKKVV